MVVKANFVSGNRFGTFNPMQSFDKKINTEIYIWFYFKKEWITYTKFYKRMPN